MVHEVDLAVDSPAGKRRRGGRPAGDTLFTAEKPDPYDEKVLITVKEAAWMPSLPEHAIRQAVSFGYLDRVFIGEGVKNYRIVYGSLPAWVNSMPRESAKRLAVKVHAQHWGPPDPPKLLVSARRVARELEVPTWKANEICWCWTGASTRRVKCTTESREPPWTPSRAWSPTA